jgi:hypothetical protein
MSSIQFLKKISTVKLGFEKAQIRELCKSAPAGLYQVYGVATGMTQGQTDMGEYVKFTGQFEVQNLVTGEILRSAQLFLPDAVSALLESQLTTEASAEGFKGVQFAFEVGAIYSKDSATEYEYTTKNLMPESESDLLSSMRKMLLSK